MSDDIHQKHMLLLMYGVKTSFVTRSALFPLSRLPFQKLPPFGFSGRLFIVPFVGIKVRQLQTILRAPVTSEMEGINITTVAVVEKMPEKIIDISDLQIKRNMVAHPSL